MKQLNPSEMLTPGFLLGVCELWFVLIPLSPIEDTVYLLRLYFHITAPPSHPVEYNVLTKAPSSVCMIGRLHNKCIYSVNPLPVL